MVPFFGLLAGNIGASIAFVATFWLKFYAARRKKQMTNEVLDLKSKHILSEMEVDKLKNQIGQIYGDAPK
jgi:hypothetical protein